MSELSSLHLSTSTTTNETESNAKEAAKRRAARENTATRLESDGEGLKRTLGVIRRPSGKLENGAEEEIVYVDKHRVYFES